VEIVVHAAVLAMVVIGEACLEIEVGGGATDPIAIAGEGVMTALAEMLVDRELEEGEVEDTVIGTETVVGTGRGAHSKNLLRLRQW